jgi:hypothetical protein
LALQGSMKHIVNFSGGLCSFWAAHRIVQKFGPSDVTLLFADTLIEDDDLYAFNIKSAEILGIPITRISEGLEPWDLFERQGIIGNSKYPICSVYLKREPLDAFHRANFLELDATLYLGFDWTEEHRLADLRREKPTWRIEAPMTEEPIWDKCRMQKEADKIGLPRCKLYELGFPHNNCGGFCVRAGISHFVHLYHVLPARYAYHEGKEKVCMARLRERGIEPLSILKDRRGGTPKMLTLEMLRKRIEAGEKMPKHEWGGCGCGGATK